MKHKERSKTTLQFPLPAHMYERAKKELDQANQQNVSKLLVNENILTHAFVTRRNNSLLYCNFLGVQGLGNQKKIV